MNSFTVHAVGHLARNPELVAKGDCTHARFRLVGNDYAGKDEEGAACEVITTLWFVAFGAVGETIARNAQGRSVDRRGQDPGEQLDEQAGRETVRPLFRSRRLRFGAPGRAKREELADTLPRSLRRSFT